MNMKVWKPTQEEIDATISWGEWSKEKSTFPWYYDDTETCYILEGSAEVSNGTGHQIKFSKGDMVRFEQGLECVWKITDNLKKKFMFL